MKPAWSLFWSTAKKRWVLKYKTGGTWAQKALPSDILEDEGPKKRKASGGRKPRQGSFPLTRAEIWSTEWLANAEALDLRPRGRSTGLTLRDAVEVWKTSRGELDALTSPATLQRFGGDMRNVMRPFLDRGIARSLGDETVVALGTDLALLRRWFRALVTTLSPWRARSAFSTLRSFFDDALVEKWFRGVNPMKNEALTRELPPLPNKAERGGVVLVDLEVMQKLVLHPYTPLNRAARYVVALTLGKREGELSGACWGDVHLDAATPHIEVVRARRLVRRAGEERGPLKSASSRGVLPLHPAAVAALREWRDDEDTGITLLLGRRPRSSDPVFPGQQVGRKGAFVRPRSAHLLREDLELAGLPTTDAKGRNATMHACRRSFATWLRRAGVPEHLRKALMRHGANDVTEDFYTENLPEMAEAVSRIALEWRVVRRVVPTLVPGGTKAGENLKHNGSRESGLNRRPALYESRSNARNLVPTEQESPAATASSGTETAHARQDSARLEASSPVPGTKAAGPGVRRVPPGFEGTRIEHDGKVVARAEAYEGEEFASFNARFLLARAQRGGR